MPRAAGARGNLEGQARLQQDFKGIHGPRGLGEQGRHVDVLLHQGPRLRLEHPVREHQVRGAVRRAGDRALGQGGERRPGAFGTDGKGVSPWRGKYLHGASLGPCELEDVT